jgi:hypothetical protein
VWSGDRSSNKEASAAAVLELLVEWASRAGAAKTDNTDTPGDGR